MPADAGQSDTVSHATAGRAGTSPLRRRAASNAGLSLPTVEVELTRVRPRPASRAVARLNVAWLLFGVFGLTSLLAASDARTGGLIASMLILYLLTVGALVWAAIETRWVARRRSCGSPPRFVGHDVNPAHGTARVSENHVP